MPQGRVKTHRRRTKGGKVVQVQEHARKVKSGQIKPKTTDFYAIRKLLRSGKIRLPKDKKEARSVAVSIEEAAYNAWATEKISIDDFKLIKNCNSRAVIHVEQGSTVGQYIGEFWKIPDKLRSQIGLTEILAKRGILRS